MNGVAPPRSESAAAAELDEGDMNCERLCFVVEIYGITIEEESAKAFIYYIYIEDRNLLFYYIYILVIN